ncbi:hypothetical protein L914_14351 [Phytophthora nicotianae]|uniref:Uncharacterized protein n=1 Tax=Phytophthora nicotianae TaxID=4792 RepID=W2MT83_PHYNI|nr:hypothetical protein L914_14351 [Phytophthora nicotianae]
MRSFKNRQQLTHFSALQHQNEPPTCSAVIKTIDHDQVQTFSQPEPASNSEKTAVKFKPLLHISDGCHPANGDCNYPDVGGQVYSRSNWYKDKWAIVYASPNPDASAILGVSLSIPTGYEKEVPPKAKYIEGEETVKLDSYVDYWVGNQSLSFTRKWGKTKREQLTDEARDSLGMFDFQPESSQVNVAMPLKNGVFLSNLRETYPKTEGLDT